MPEILNKFTAEAFTPSQYEETEEGFLRVKARVLAERVMPYLRKEIDGGIPPELDGVEPIMVLVTAGEMGAAESLRTLEGAAVVAPGHQWIDTNTRRASKGNTAGAPHLDGPYLTTDLLLTEPDTIQKIKNREIGEISGAYLAALVFEPGTHDGVPYHAKQTALRWNHVAVIPYGSGRAGSDVRIINRKPEGGEKMAGETESKLTTRVQLKNTKRFINTDEEGSMALEKENEATEAAQSAEAQKSGQSLESLMSDLEQKTQELAQKEAEVEELRGQLSVFQEEIQRLLSDEAAEESTEAHVAESSDADEIIENCCAGLSEPDGAKLRASFSRIGNTNIHKLRGPALHKAVLSATGMPIENMTPAELKGAFAARAHVANATKKVRSQKTENKKVVSGQQLFGNQAEAEAAFTDQHKTRTGVLWGRKS